MSGPLPQTAFQRRANAGLIATFFIFLWLPTADTFLHLDRTPTPNENRAPATFPTFQPDFAAMRDYVSGIEAYFGDHFGFRRRLVAWGHHWKWQWFRTSKSADAFVGKSGWLFFSGGLMVDDIMGNRPFSDRELEAWRDLLQGRSDWLAQRGIRYLFVIPPDKHTIYPEYLPDWLATATRPPHRLDQFLAYMKAHTAVPILDLRQTLLDAKKDGRVYLQTDTHWNEMGAFLACRRIVEQAAALGMDVKPVALPAFQVSTKDEASGDLAMMLGRQNTMLEMDMVSVSPKPPLPVLETSIASDFPNKKWFFGVEPRITNNPAARGKVVMFRDSFAINLSRFLGYSFARIAYIWEQNWDKRIIESEKPDLVVDEMLERFLITRDPLELKKKDEDPNAQLFGGR
jgi:hypothetical protein